MNATVNLARAVLALSSILTGALGQRILEPAPAAFRADSRLVLVPVIVTDRRGATVNGLTAKSFAVLEGKAPQPILSFTEEDVPCSIGIVFDLSGSMANRLPDAKRALKAFLDLAEPEDEGFLVSVSNRPGAPGAFTRDLPALLGAVTPQAAAGSTPLVDAIYSTLAAMKKAHNRRRALLVVSDGMDNNSRYTASELFNFAVEADVEIHTVAIYAASIYKKPIELQEEKRGVRFMDDLANRTGGLSFAVRGDSEMRDAAGAIGKALRSQYVIGYRPGSAPDGKWRRVQIKMTPPGIKAHTRGGYLAE